MTSRLMAARFKGKCRICGKTVDVGDQVYFAKHYGVRCQSCGPHTAQDKPLPPKKGSKRSKMAEAVKTFTPDAPADPKSRQAVKCADGVWRYELDGVTDAVQDALADYAQNDSNRQEIAAELSDALSGHRGWSNYFTKDKFLAQLAEPPKSLLNAVDEMREQLIEELSLPTRPRRRVRHGQEFGDDLDPERVLVRDFNPWDRTIRETQPRRNVTIGCNLSVNSGVRAEQLLHRGAAALALADILTSQGLNVSIVVFESVNGPTDAVSRGLMRCVLKDHSMPLDINAVAFAMCEIAWVRVVGIIGEMRHFPGKISPGYGSATRLPEAERQSCDFVIESNILDKVSATAWLKKSLGHKEVEYV